MCVYLWGCKVFADDFIKVTFIDIRTNLSMTSVKRSEVFRNCKGFHRLNICILTTLCRYNKASDYESKNKKYESK